MAYKIVVFVLSSFLPRSLRLLVLSKCLGYEIHRSSHISRLCCVVPEHLHMAEGARIGAFTVALHLSSLSVGKFSSIGRSNWITGHSNHSLNHFAHVVGRNSSLVLGDHSAITKGHLIDCTHQIRIGSFTTVAGYRSQFLTHGIDLETCRQHCQPIEIGSYCLVGSGVIFLGGARLPSFSVVGAGSVVNKPHMNEHRLYAGAPALERKVLSPDAAYFSRSSGFVS